MSDACDPMDCSLPGSSVHGILQASILKWVSFSSPGYLSDPGIKPESPALQADSLPTELQGKPLSTLTFPHCQIRLILSWWWSRDLNLVLLLSKLVYVNTSLARRTFCLNWQAAVTQV